LQKGTRARALLLWERMSLKAKVIVQCMLTAVVVGVMLFLPAGTWKYWQGWIFLGLLMIPMLVASIYFVERDPQLVERRLQSKEKVGEQKLIMKFAKLIFLAAFLIPGFDFRFGWSRRTFGGVPVWLMILSGVIALAGYLLTYWVMGTNSYASRIIQVEKDQRVISIGPYRIVRHPMYLGGVISILFAPLALGSYWALPGFALVIPVIVLRLLNEEKILRQELPGYSEYCQSTRFRLIPLVW
jgi:protein-S-isoprenylcysteine O-methyltransferase Ste14